MPKATPVSDDAQVVNAAMGEFFVKSPWNREWTKGDCAALDGEWSDDFRLDFGAIASKAFPYAQKEDKALLKPLLMVKPGKESPIIPLKKLTLDSRVLVGAKPYAAKEWRGWTSGEGRVKGSDGEVKTVRAKGVLDPPCYSADGRYAILIMRNLPWSIHSVDMHFFLQRQVPGWRVICAVPLFYV